jgi:hypothetical protein
VGVALLADVPDDADVVLDEVPDDDVPEVVADTAVPDADDVSLAAVAVVAAATVFVLPGWARLIAPSVAPNSRAAVARRAAAVRRPERPGRTRRLGIRAERMPAGCDPAVGRR